MSNDPSAAPVPLRLDKEYQAFPLRDIDHETLNKWCRREYLDRVKQSTDDPQLLTVAMNETLDMTWLGKGRIVMRTARGWHKLAEVMARTSIPYEAVANSQGIAEVVEAFMSLYPGDYNTDDTPDNKEPEGNA